MRDGKSNDDYNWCSNILELLLAGCEMIKIVLLLEDIFSCFNPRGLILFDLEFWPVHTMKLLLKVRVYWMPSCHKLFWYEDCCVCLKEQFCSWHNDKLLNFHEILCLQSGQKRIKTLLNLASDATHKQVSNHYWNYPKYNCLFVYL